LISRDEVELVSMLVWRVKLVAELEPGLTTEVEVARLERDQRWPGKFAHADKCACHE
jgi:hypothetical protein